jgi:hypothetical protein
VLDQLLLSNQIVRVQADGGAWYQDVVKVETVAWSPTVAQRDFSCVPSGNWDLRKTMKMQRVQVKTRIKLGGRCL